MVSDSSISTDMWDAIKTICVASLSTASISGSVEAAFTPKKNGKPVVIIPPVKTPKVKNKFGSGNKGRYDMTATVYCYARNTLDVDNLKQAIFNGLDTTPIDGVSLNSLDDDYSFAEINDAVWHLQTITATYNRE